MNATPATGVIRTRQPRQRAGGFREILRGLRRSPAALSGIILLVVSVLVAVFAPVLATHDPLAIDAASSFVRPSLEHFFGTDQYGRDVYSRVVYGGRNAMLIALTASFLAIVVGSALGIALAYAGRWVDEVGSRLLDGVLSIPQIVIMLVVLSALGSSYIVLVVAMIIAFAPGSARVVRSAALEVRQRDYVTAAIARGDRRPFVMWREIYPNVRDVVFVEFALRASWAFLLISALSFLGFGVSPPTPDWGLMIAENRDGLSIAPWATIFPIIALGLMVLSLNLASDGLSKVLGIELTKGAPQ